MEQYPGTSSPGNPGGDLGTCSRPSRARRCMRAPRAIFGHRRSRGTGEGPGMNRREFGAAVAVLAGLRSARQASGDAEGPLLVMTVCGPIPPEQMGLTLPHEHILVDFIGADRCHPRPLRCQRGRARGSVPPAAHPGAGRPDAGRVHAGFPGTRPYPATASGGGQRPALVDQHRLLRRQRRQAPACSRADRIGRIAGPTLAPRMA